MSAFNDAVASGRFAPDPVVPDRVSRVGGPARRTISVSQFAELMGIEDPKRLIDVERHGDTFVLLLEPEEPR